MDDVATVPLQGQAVPVAAPRRSIHDTLTMALLGASEKICDHHGDGPAARAEMRADCLATPPALRRDLLEHFQDEHRKRSTAAAAARAPCGYQPTTMEP